MPTELLGRASYGAVRDDVVEILLVRKRLVRWVLMWQITRYVSQDAVVHNHEKQCSTKCASTTQFNLAYITGANGDRACTKVIEMTEAYAIVV